MLLSSISLALTRLGQQLGRWSPLALWPNGVDSPGMWISPSTLPASFNDYTGTTPVVEPGTVADSANPVGLALDLRAGTVTASPSTADLSGATWTRYAATTLGNQITFTGQYGNIGKTGFFPANTAAVSIGRIVLTLDIEHVSGNTNLATAFRDSAVPGGNVIYPLILTSGQRTTLTQIHVLIGDVPPAVPEILIVQDRNTSNFAVVKLHSVTYAYTPGNHMFQATSAARPLESARVNLLTKTDDFADAVWQTVATTASANTATAPDGTTTADTLSEGVSSDRHITYVDNLAVTSGWTYTLSVYAKYVDRQYAVLGLDAGPISRVYFDLVNGTVTSEVSCTGAISSAGGGWYRLSLTATAASTGSYPQFAMSDRSAPGGSMAFDMPVYAGTSKTVQIWGAQLNIGSTATAYQRVNTASDYDATGITPFQLYDGVDDGMATASFAAGTLINGMDCMIAVRRDSAGSQAQVVGLYTVDTAKLFGAVQSGGTDPVNYSAGDPDIYVDGCIVYPCTRDTLNTALTANAWHILEFCNLDLSMWDSLEFGRHIYARFPGARGDIMLYPSTASTADKDAARQYLADKYGVTLP